MRNIRIMSRRKTLRSPRSARKERRKKSRKILLFSVFFAVAAGGALYGFSRPEFRLTTVEITGSTEMPADRIRERVLEELSGTTLGFIPKSHTFFYPKAALKESLIKEFPALSGVAISLQSLSALRVSLNERKPRALWCVSPQDCFLIDETGTLFARPETGTERLYYRLLGKAAEAKLGVNVIEQERLAEALLFLKKLTDSGLEPEKTLFKEQREIEVTLRGGTRLLLREGEYDQARANLETLMGQTDLLPKKNGALSVTYIDLRYGNKIYFKPR